MGAFIEDIASLRDEDIQDAINTLHFRGDIPDESVGLVGRQHLLVREFRWVMPTEFCDLSESGIIRWPEFGFLKGVDADEAARQLAGLVSHEGAEESEVEARVRFGRILALFAAKTVPPCLSYREEKIDGWHRACVAWALGEQLFVVDIEVRLP